MQREADTLNELKGRQACLHADLYQQCGSLTVTALERLCRKINVIGLRIYSFKGGRHGKE